MKRIILLSLAVLLFLAAAGLTVYPLVSNYVNDKHQSTIRTEYVKEIKEADNAELQAARKAALAYNESLQPIRYDREAVQTAAENYDSVLDLTGSGIMGYVEIPKLGLHLPIYHGTEDDVLQKGIGHLIGSSLPVGGAGSHTVLTGHSGVAGARLFSDLDQLSPGDMFFLHVLGETLAYRVTDINTVLPHETELLTAIPGADLCTLVTCTPYGVNSHRLLVRGSRVPFDKTAEETQPVLSGEAPQRASTWKKHYQRSLLIGSGIAVGVTGVWLALNLLRKKRRRERNET